MNMRRARQKQRVMTAIRVVLDMLHSAILDEPWVMQHVVWLLMAAMGEESVRTTAARILKEKIVDPIVHTISRTSGKREHLKPVLQDIVCSLFEYSVQGSVGSEYLTSIIEQLVVTAPRALDDVIKKLPPFPDQPRFDRILRRCRDARERDSNWTLNEDILQFLNVELHAHAEVLHACLHHLCVQVR